MFSNQTLYKFDLGKVEIKFTKFSKELASNLFLLNASWKKIREIEEEESIIQIQPWFFTF